MPLKHSKDDFKRRQKDVFVLILDIIVEYDLSYFAASFVARILWNCRAFFSHRSFINCCLFIPLQDLLEYKSKIRLLKVYTMDGAVKTVQVRYCDFRDECCKIIEHC